MLSKIRKEMEEEDLAHVGSIGLVIYNQDGTGGNLVLSHSLLHSAGAKVCYPLKLTLTKFWTFSSLPLPVDTAFFSKIHLSETLRSVPTLC